MKQKITYLLSLMLMCIFGATGMQGKSASETIFSADVIATSNQAFSPGTTEITSAQATLQGGKMYAISEQESDKNLIGLQNKNGMFCMTNNNTFFKVVLNQALANGDVINCKTYSRTDTGLGVWVSKESSRPNSCSSALSIASVATAAYEALSTYTVKDGDGLAGVTTIYLYRETGKSTYFDEFVITRASQEPTPDPEPTSGVIYSMTAPTAPEGGLASGTGSDLTATYVGGSGYVYNGKSSAAVMCQSSQVKLGGSSASYFQVKMDETLKAGDVITLYTLGLESESITTADAFFVSTSTTKGSSKYTFPYTVTSTDGLAGKKDIYFWKNEAKVIGSVVIERTSGGSVGPYVPTTNIEFTPSELTIEEFDEANIGVKFTPSNATDQSLTWTTSNPDVATVKNGVITGVKEGTTTITATSVDGPSKTVEVTVTPCAPKNVAIKMTSDSEAKAPRVEKDKKYTLTANAQGYGLTYQWASKATEKGSYANISGATAQTYEATAVELGSKFYKVTVTNAQGSAVAEYEVKTIVPLEAFTIAETDTETGEVIAINYKALDADEPQVKVVSQATKAGEETNVVLPEAVEYNGVTYAVTTIGEEAYVNDNTVVSFTAPESLTEISARAFMSCVNLSEVTLNNGLKVIGDAAFSGCNALTEFYIPASVEYVGFKAFTDCKSLTDIYYDGTKAEWDALPYTGLAGIAKSVTIHFNDGETEGGKGNIVGISNANADETQKDGKFVENGQIVIYKNGKKYNAAGAEIK